MPNPYLPPTTPLKDDSQQPVYTDQYKREKSAIRPIGVVVVVALFFLFSAIGTAFQMAQGGMWWIGYVAFTALFAYWFRKLWWGDNRERKIGVFVGFMIAAFSYVGSPEGPVESWPADELASLADGCYFFFASCYLIYARKNPFFEDRAP